MLHGFVLAGLLLSQFSLAHAYNPEDLSNDEGRAILCSVLAKLQATNGKDVWPGYNAIEAPLIIKFQDGVFGYGDSTAFKGWKENRVDGCASYSAPQEYTAPTSPIVPYLDFNGTKAFFFDATIKPKLSTWLLSAVIHERFHRFQWEHFTNIFPLLNSIYTGHSSTEPVAASLLENRRLGSFLKTHDDSKWIDFLSISVVRELELSEESKKWEVGQQIAEGTAVFVQLKAFDAVEREFGLKFRETWKQRMMGSLADSEGIDGIVKWRHYAVGSMICSYLDEHSFDDKWKLAIQTENATSLFRMVLPIVGIDEANLRARGLSAMRSTEAKQARADASRMISTYVHEIDEAKNKISASNLQVKVIRPNEKCSGGGASEKSYYLPEGGTLGLNYSGSYQCGGSYLENFADVPILHESKGSAYFGLEKLRIWIDGSEIQIRDGNYPFIDVKLEGSTFSLRSSLSGVLSVAGSKFSFVFRK